MMRIALCDDNKEDMLQYIRKLLSGIGKIVKIKVFL